MHFNDAIFNVVSAFRLDQKSTTFFFFSSQLILLPYPLILARHHPVAPILSVAYKTTQARAPAAQATSAILTRVADRNVFSIPIAQPISPASMPSAETLVPALAPKMPNAESSIINPLALVSSDTPEILSAVAIL